MIAAAERKRHVRNDVPLHRGFSRQRTTPARTIYLGGTSDQMMDQTMEAATCLSQSQSRSIFQQPRMATRAFQPCRRTNDSTHQRRKLAHENGWHHYLLLRVLHTLFTLTP